MKDKHLSTGKKLLVALFFSISVIFLGIFLGFFIKYFYLGITTHNNDLIDESFMFLLPLLLKELYLFLISEYFIFIGSIKSYIIIYGSFI